MLGTLLTGCDADECSVNYVLGGAIEYAYVWRHPSTECELSTVPGNIEFRTGTSRLEFLSDTAFTVGSHIVDVIYISKEGISWSNAGTCTMVIESSEFVDWVWEDHQRISGTVECSGSFSSPGQSALTLSNVEFTIYAADGSFFF